ncbi:MAG: helix-turn-helix transcriptional regulator [Clostridia bacterium]|nr:helix-turn-helix transcriptional regulator [Clostridia bacterium]
MSLGKKVRRAREDMNLSQSDVAKLIPMNQSNYSKIERDLQEPNIDQLKKICIILKLDPRYLLGLDGAEVITQRDRQLLQQVKDIIHQYK